MLDNLKTKIKTVFLSKSFKKAMFLGFFACLVFWAWVDYSFAAGSSDEAHLISDLLKLLQQILAISWALLWGLTALVSLLLEPKLTNWAVFNLREYIHETWILVSNVVYFIFAWLLIVISFANIIWKWSWELFELKKALPRFIIGILIVPFSWYIVQFVIGITSFLSASIYMLPFDTIDTKVWKDSILEKSVNNWCDERIINLQWESVKISQSWDWWNTSITSSWFFVCTKPDKVRTIREIITYKNTDWEISIGSAIWLYTFWIMEVGTLDKVRTAQFSDLTTLMKLWWKTLFDIVFIIVYLLILIALFLALFVRIIALWIFMSVSPLFWLMFFLQKWKLWEKVEKLSFKSFIELAMVPVYVAAALSFGLMFLFVIWKGLASNSDNTLKMDQFNVGTVTIKVQWAWWDSSNGKNFISAVFWEVKSLFGYLLFKMFWLAFLWMAVIAALQSSKITSKVIDPIAKFWGQVWEMVQQAPMYMPVPGTSGISWTGKMASLWAMLDWTSKWIKWITSDKQFEWARKFAEKNFPGAVSEEVKKTLDKISQINTPDALKSFMKETSTDVIASNWSIRESLAKAMERTKVWDENNRASLKSANNWEIDKVSKSLEAINGRDWKLYWKDKNAEEIKTYKWAASDTTSTSWTNQQPVNQTTTYNINYDVGWIEKEWRDISWDGKEFAMSLKIQLEAEKGKLDPDKFIKQLAAKFWNNDKNKIETIVESLYKENFFNKSINLEQLKKKVNDLLPADTSK